jgi:ABC-type glutathione transport system ATPase component
LEPDGTHSLRERHAELRGQRKTLARERDEVSRALKELEAALELAPKVEQALEHLSEELFGRLARTLETHLTRALQEVLEQPIELKVRRDFKRGSATMKLFIERAGQEEDIIRGQGGSVANVLSVGLRFLALMTLDPKLHRRCLILDEQDCWLAPELVPRLVRLVSQAARSLGFQVIMVSHHEVAVFEQYADRILRVAPTEDGAKVEWVFEPVEP